MAITASPKVSRSGALIDATFLDDLLQKLNVSNQILMTVVGRRLIAEQKATASDLWRMLSLRGDAKATEIATSIGDSVSAISIGRLLNLKKSAVHKAKDTNRLLAFNLSARVGDHFPVFQIENGKVRDWVPSLLRLVGNGLPAIHFFTVKRKSLDGASYFDLLREGDRPEVIDAMLAQAASIGDPAAMPLPKLSARTTTAAA